MANTSAIWQPAAHTIYHLLAVQLVPYKKAKLLMKKASEFSGKKVSS